MALSINYEPLYRSALRTVVHERKRGGDAYRDLYLREQGKRLGDVQRMADDVERIERAHRAHQVGHELDAMTSTGIR